MIESRPRVSLVMCGAGVSKPSPVYTSHAYRKGNPRKIDRRIDQSTFQRPRPPLVAQCNGGCSTVLAHQMGARLGQSKRMADMDIDNQWPKVEILPYPRRPSILLVGQAYIWSPSLNKPCSGLATLPTGNHTAKSSFRAKSFFLQALPVGRKKWLFGS